MKVQVKSINNQLMNNAIELHRTEKACRASTCVITACKFVIVRPSCACLQCLPAN